MRTVCNPFVFLLQIINLLPPVRAGYSGSCETTSAHACDAPIWRVPDLRVSTPWDSLRHGQATACAVDDWQAAAPCNSTISSRPAAISTIGRGGCTSPRTIRNPFVFLLQIINLLLPVRAGCSESCETTSARA
ncbi:hypothetical protein MRX96_020381 [Rhipicephalus microplus]